MFLWVQFNGFRLRVETVISQKHKDAVIVCRLFCWHFFLLKSFLVGAVAIITYYPDSPCKNLFISGLTLDSFNSVWCRNP